MEKSYSSVSTCFRKGSAMGDMKQNELNQEKNTGEIMQKEVTTDPNTRATGGLAWRLTSGLYSAGAGAANLAVTGAKWAAFTTYGVGSTVVGSGLNTVKKFSGKSKDKNE